MAAESYICKPLNSTGATSSMRGIDGFHHGLQGHTTEEVDKPAHVAQKHRFSQGTAAGSCYPVLSAAKHNSSCRLLQDTFTGSSQAI